MWSTPKTMTNSETEWYETKENKNYIYGSTSTETKLLVRDRATQGRLNLSKAAITMIAFTQ